MVVVVMMMMMMLMMMLLMMLPALTLAAQERESGSVGSIATGYRGCAACCM